MSAIYVPSRGPDDWRQLLAEPEKQWEPGYSAKTMAHCWEAASGFPLEIQDLLNQHPDLHGARPLLIFPEWKVALRGGSTASQNDAWVLAKSEAGLISIAVEGKVDEPFDKILGEWKVPASEGKKVRLAYLAEVLGIAVPIPDTIRYQLLHRAASAVIEAERFNASHAVMLVHSFSPQNMWFDDYARFVELFGQSAEIGRLSTSKAGNQKPLHFGWARGDEKFLEERRPRQQAVES